jgi:chromosomal replication initiation ATPase DnaA
MSLAILPRKERPQSLKWLIPELTTLQKVHDIVREQVGYEFRVNSKESRFLKPRQVAMWLMRKASNASYPEISYFYKLHHTTVIHSVQQIDWQRAHNEACFADTEFLWSLVLKAISRESIPASESGA